MPADSGTWHALVTGRVQGVGFRWFARERARSLGVQGWVRNRADGSVEILARGELSRLEQFKSLMREGPRGAAVQDTRELPLGSDDIGESFEIVR